ncbi:MAG: WD40/YVTN/BNR-like repeat-containing protein [Actinomycetota bacterium]
MDWTVPRAGRGPLGVSMVGGRSINASHVPQKGAVDGEGVVAVSTEVLVGTRKGLFVLRGEREGPLEIVARHFDEVPVDFFGFDPRSGTYLAGVTHWPEEFKEYAPGGLTGPRLWFTEDPHGEWQESEGLSFPEDAGANLEKVWAIQPGSLDQEIWAGVAPAALFRSGDGGRNWELSRGLWDQPTRPNWTAGGGGLCLHSICPYPGNPAKLTVAVSAAGVWHTDDGGITWEKRAEGLPGWPEDAPAQDKIQCVHNVHRSPVQPETLYLQFHNGVFRSDDGARSWHSIAEGLPSDFGLPMAIDPTNPDRAFVIPLGSQSDRVTLDGKVRVYETTDRGSTWTALDRGLPGKGAYLTLLRQAFCTDGRSPLGMYFGATSGDLYGTADGGQTWFEAARHLPPVHSVRMGKI